MSAPLDRRVPPKAGTSRPFVFPQFEHLEVVPGLDGYVAPLDRGPIVAVELVLPGGGELDRHDTSGRSALAASLLDDGCPDLTATEISHRIERLGGSVTATSDWDAAYLGLTVPATHAIDALDLVATLALTADFPTEEIERGIERRRQELLRRRSRPAAMASDALMARLYDGPYSTPLLGTVDGLGAIDREQVTRFADRHLRRGRAYLLLAGELDRDRCLEIARDRFGGWSPAPESDRPATRPLTRQRLRAVVVNRPDAAQTELRIGHDGPRRTDPDRVALSVMNTLLGGKFTSRINLNLRERHGFTYGAHSRLSARRGRGPFVISAAVTTDSVGAAAQEALAEVERLRTEPITPDELADTVGYLRGVQPYTLQTVDDFAGRLAQLAVFDLADDHYETVRRQLEATTADDVQRVAREHLRPGEMVVVAVGPAEEITPQLHQLTDSVEVVANEA